MSDNASTRIRLMGLWKQKAKNGREYLSGRLSGMTKVLVFENERKQGANSPDYFVYLVPNSGRRQGGQPQGNEPDDGPPDENVPY